MQQRDVAVVVGEAKQLRVHAVLDKGVEKLARRVGVENDGVEVGMLSVGGQVRAGVGSEGKQKHGRVPVAFVKALVEHADSAAVCGIGFFRMQI